MNIDILLCLVSSFVAQPPEPLVLPQPKEIISLPAPPKTGAATAGADAAREKLQEERKRLEQSRLETEQALKELPENMSGERAKLRLQLINLMKMLSDRSPAKVNESNAKDTKSETSKERPKAYFDPAKVVDAISLAQNLFRTGDHEAALRAFQLMELSTLPKADRAYVQYMTGCCLRRLGKMNEAAAAYREVAEAKEDEFLAECATWQIGSIRSRQELVTQLEELRARRKEP
jgi:tetratricopeptide (TPR) repeat protein